MNKTNIVLGVVVALVFVLFNAVFIVNERQVAVTTQFSKLVDTNNTAGLKFKLPFIQHVEYMDGRIQKLDVDPEMFLTNEKKYLIVDYIVVWRINDVAKFYTTVRGDMRRAGDLIDQLVKDGLRGEFVLRSVREVISQDRSDIMGKVHAALSVDAKRYGVEIVDVRLKRVDFSDDIRDRVFARMRAERERVSRSLRAQGQEKASVIRANAEKTAAVIMADAQKKAQIKRGQADASAAMIYAQAYSKNFEFYQFWRSMQAYQTSFTEGSNNVLVVSPESAFFKYMRMVGQPEESRMEALSPAEIEDATRQLKELSESDFIVPALEELRPELEVSPDQHLELNSTAPAQKEAEETLEAENAQDLLNAAAPSPAALPAPAAPPQAVPILQPAVPTQKNEGSETPKGLPVSP